jgi:hypothetical protein
VHGTRDGGENKQHLREHDGTLTKIREASIADEFAEEGSRE